MHISTLVHSGRPKAMGGSEVPDAQRHRSADDHLTFLANIARRERTRPRRDEARADDGTSLPGVSKDKRPPTPPRPPRRDAGAVTRHKLYMVAAGTALRMRCAGLPSHPLPDRGVGRPGRALPQGALLSCDHNPSATATAITATTAAISGASHV
jgi:hypothetical protein